MLTIRDAQLEVFRRERIRSFENRLFAVFLSSFASDFKTTPDVLIRAEIQDSAAQALAQGFMAERDIARFTFLRHMLGPGFESDTRFPWAAETLADRELAPASKIDIISIHARHELGAKFVSME